MHDLTPFAFETVTVASANVATSLTKVKYAPSSGGLPASAAIITIGVGPRISYIFGGVTVGSATGHVGTPFGTIPLTGNQQIRDFRTTSVRSGTPATIMITYFK